PHLQLAVGDVVGPGSYPAQAVGELLHGAGHGGIDVVRLIGHVPCIYEVSGTVRKCTGDDTPGNQSARPLTCGFPVESPTPSRGPSNSGRICSTPPTYTVMAVPNG